MRNHSSVRPIKFSLRSFVMLAIPSGVVDFTVGFTLGIKSNKNNNNPVKVKVKEEFAANENQRTFSSDIDIDTDRY